MKTPFRYGSILAVVRISALWIGSALLDRADDGQVLGYALVLLSMPEALLARGLRFDPFVWKLCLSLLVLLGSYAVVYAVCKNSMKEFVLMAVLIVAAIVSVGAQAADLPADFLNGKQFESVQEFPQFRSEQMGRNSIEFTDAAWSWIHGDIAESGTFTIDAQGNITAVKDYGEDVLTGTYDAVTQILLWDGLEYVERKPVKTEP